MIFKIVHSVERFWTTRHNIEPSIKLLSFYCTWLAIMSKDPLSPLTKIKAMLESSSHRGGRPTQFQIPRENIYIYLKAVLYQKHVLKRGRKVLWIQQPRMIRYANFNSLTTSKHVEFQHTRSSGLLIYHHSYGKFVFLKLFDPSLRT